MKLGLFGCRGCVERGSTRQAAGLHHLAAGFGWDDGVVVDGGAWGRGPSLAVGVRMRPVGVGGFDAGAGLGGRLRRADAPAGLFISGGRPGVSPSASPGYEAFAASRLNSR